MENPGDKDSTQSNITETEEKKRDPISQFFLDMKDDIESFSEKSGDFFLNIKQDMKKDWEDIKTSWNDMKKSIKEKDPKYKRFKKLYSKLKKMESELTEIKEDTKEIKLDISQVSFMIEHLMENISDIEGYMKKNLGSDWKIIKNSWQRCKEGEISKGEFVKIGLSKIGKKFAGIFLRV